MPRKLSRERAKLSLGARRILDKYGVESPEQLRKPPKLTAPELERKYTLLDCIASGTQVGREIVGWARLNGVSIGPSEEWLVLFDAAVASRLPTWCRRTLWIAARRHPSPKNIPFEDVVMIYPPETRGDRERFRAWAKNYADRFAPPVLVGLSDKIRKRLRWKKLSTPAEVAQCTRAELAGAKFGPQGIEEVVEWLAGHGLELTQFPDNWLVWTASLSNRGKRILQHLGIKHRGDMSKLSSSSLARIHQHRSNHSFKECRFCKEILSWAKSQGFDQFTD